MSKTEIIVGDYTSETGHGVFFSGTPREVLNQLGRLPHVSGPNGPVTSKRIILRDGEAISVLEACKRFGLSAAFRLDIFDREVFAGVI